MFKLAISFSLVLGTEKMRDGGSLATIFQCSDACEYRLQIPVKLADNQTAGFKSPVLINKSITIEVYLAWESAIALLNQILTVATEDEHLKVIKQMLEIVHANQNNT